jgi:translocation and assembly module TamA
LHAPFVTRQRARQPNLQAPRTLIATPVPDRRIACHLVTRQVNAEAAGSGRTACLLLLAGLFWISVASAQDRLSVEITGIEGDLLKNVHAFLSIAQLQPERGLLPVPLPGLEAKEAKAFSDSDVRRLHKRAVTEIRQALQPYGYYAPTVEASLEKVKGEWHARYHIDPGPATLVRQIDIKVEGPGKGDAGIQQALAAVSLRAKKRLIHSQYDDAKKALLAAATSAGYLDARFVRSEMRVAPAEQQADIALAMDTGPRYFFGPITVRQEVLAPDFVARFVKAQPGEPFDTKKLLAAQLALSDSGYFQRVEVQIQREDTHDFRIPVVIETDPNKPRRYATGLGFGTDTGPRLSLAAEFRRINRRGHSILTDVRFSKIKNAFSVQYKIPVKNVETDRLVFSGTAESEDVSADGNTTRYTLGASLNDLWGPFQRRLYINFQHENFSIGEDDDTVDYLIPGASLSQLRADDALFPRRGYSWSADVRGSAQTLLSETSFVRSEAAIRLVLPLGERARLVSRGQIGGIAVEDFSKLPLTERFFAGGDQSVRGYAYQRLGPTDDSGEVVGGRYLSVVSAEVDYLFIGNFGAAVFVDAGNADDNFPPDLYTGAGIGFRWRSPVGMLRVDFAHPFTDSDDKFRIHISIGPTL